MSSSETLPSVTQEHFAHASICEILNTLYEIRYTWLRTPRGIDWLKRDMDSASSQSIIYRLLEVLDDYPPNDKHQEEEIANAMDYAFTALQNIITKSATHWAIANLEETYEERRQSGWIPPWERDEMREY